MNEGSGGSVPGGDYLGWSRRFDPAPWACCGLTPHTLSCAPGAHTGSEAGSLLTLACRKHVPWLGVGRGQDRVWPGPAHLWGPQ